MTEEKSMMERMLAGEFDGLEIIDDGAATEGAEEIVDTPESIGNEDTEVEEATEGNIETEDTGDGQDQENVESEVEETPENTLVESGNEEDAETEQKSDGSDEENAEIDYKKKYEELEGQSAKYKDYYDKVTSEFSANGKTVKGFTDPNKVIQAQQALYGLEEKFAMFKKYRPYHAPLEKRGMIQNQEKFDLAMNIMDGNKEAIAKHLRDLSIDPITDLELDEESNYQVEPTTASEIDLAIDDVLDTASTIGVKQDVERVLFNEWDDKSVVNLLSTPESRNVFIEHMKKDESGNSIFNEVTARVKEKSALAGGTGFSTLSSIEKYNTALQEISEEKSQNQAVQAQEPTTQVTPDMSTAISSAEKAIADKIAAAKAEAIEEYKRKLETSNNKSGNSEARNRAASLSTKHTAPSSKSDQSKTADPMKLEGKDFMDYWTKLQRVGL